MSLIIEKFAAQAQIPIGDKYIEIIHHSII
jgi:hypothetical protein